ncbi:MAG: hypothetical protein H6735_01190 [Alphaproteobacteria bacterium]|nr:hypothetical protein [Alphaproteobacteria bacterium]
MKVESGAARVVASGVVTTFGGNDLSIDLDLGADRVRVELVFTSTGGEPSVRTEDLPKGYRLCCDNFDDPYGRGSAEPVLLGALGDDLIFLHFRVQLFGRSVDRTVTYTFYRAKKADLGWVPKDG